MERLSMNVSENEIEQIAYQTGYTPFMIAQLMKNFPKDYMAVLRAFEKPPLNTIRVNTLKISPEELKERLEHKGFQLRPTKWLDYAFHVYTFDTELQLGATHEYLKGFYYIQSLGSMIPPHILFPQPDDNVLDMCAAPGSKTTQIGQMMEQKGLIIATDVKKSRIQALNHNIRRCGIQNTITIPYNAIHLKSKLASFKPNKILLDAPCSGSGIIRSDPSPKREKNDKNIKRLANKQKALLKTGLDLLQPGGYLVYSTCSFHYQENEQVIAETVLGRENIEIVEPTQNIGLPGLQEVDNLEFGYEMLKTRRLIPSLHDTDAFFFALLKKRENN